MSHPSVLDVNAATFAQDVVARSHQTPVVVDFWAPWCGPCGVLGPLLEKLAAEADGAWVLAKVDTDHNQAVAQQFRVQGIPAVKAFVNGEVVAEFVGVQSEAWLRGFLGSLVPSEADTLAHTALDALAQGDIETAVHTFEKALTADPRHSAAILGLTEAALRLGDAVRAKDVLDLLRQEDLGRNQATVSQLRLRIEAAGAGDCATLEARVQADPGDLAARYALAQVLHVEGRTEDALEHLLTIVKRDRKWRDDEARKAMLRMFDAVGARSPVAEAWRQKLALALY